MEDGTTIPLVSRRRERAQLFQKVQHGLPSLALLMHGFRGLEAGDQGLALVLSLAQIVTSVLVIGGIVQSIRRTARADGDGAAAHHGGIDWVDLFLGAMLATEAFSHQYSTGHLPRPTILGAIIMAMLGLLHGRITTYRSRRRSLTADESGLTIRGRFFSTFTATWPGIERIDIGDRYATITTREGRSKKIDLSDLKNRADVTRALERAQRRTRDQSALRNPDAQLITDNS